MSSHTIVFYCLPPNVRPRLPFPRQNACNTPSSLDNTLSTTPLACVYRRLQASWEKSSSFTSPGHLSLPLRGAAPSNNVDTPHPSPRQRLGRGKMVQGFRYRPTQPVWLRYRPHPGPIYPSVPYRLVSPAGGSQHHQCRYLRRQHWHQAFVGASQTAAVPAVASALRGSTEAGTVSQTTEKVIRIYQAPHAHSPIQIALAHHLPMAAVRPRPRLRGQGH